jgi:hypothetical protein
MLSITVAPVKILDNKTGQEVEILGGRLCLEHSLLSISKWEEKTHKPFFSQEEMAAEDLLYYIECMTVNDVDKSIYLALTNSDISEIVEYMKDTHTATWFSKNSMPKPATTSSEAMTSELIYYYMSQVQLPIEMERWNINRLFVILRIAAIKSQPPKKMDRRTAAKSNAALNRARLKGRRH